MLKLLSVVDALNWNFSSLFAYKDLNTYSAKFSTYIPCYVMCRKHKMESDVSSHHTSL